MNPAPSRRRDAHPVVVGVDFSKENAAAVDYAAVEAERRGAPLMLLHAVDPAAKLPTYLALSLDEVLGEAESELADQANALLDDYPGLTVRTTCRHQRPDDALVAASRDAGLVVLGSRGRGGFGQLLLGSTAWQVVSRAEGPVVLVRPGEVAGHRTAAPVLVGVDGSEGSLLALRFAFDEAAYRGGAVIAVNVWPAPAVTGVSADRELVGGTLTGPERGQEAANHVLSEALSGVTVEYPEVAVTEVAAQGVNVAVTLLDVASTHGVDLIVVGARGRHALTQLLLGAVGVQLSHYADRPVAIVHQS